MRRKPRIGFALGSGSARGWAHIGAIRALEERGVKPDVICGSSIGALVGAAYASGQLDKLEKWCTGLGWTTVVRLMDLSWSGGLIRGARLFNLFNTILDDVDIDELSVPYGAVATELGSGREVWLRHGKMLDAVRASCAMPGIFRPAVRDGVLLVDGGLVNPVPVSMCRALGADVVIAVDLSWGKLGVYRERGKGKEDSGNELPDGTVEMPVAPREMPGWLGRLGRGWMARTAKKVEEQVRDQIRMPSILEVFTTSLDIVEMRVARSRLSGDPADVLLTPLLPGFRTMDFHRSKEAIEEGRAAVERMAPLIEQVIG
ncbi:MAG TPA: patatin-like phospholipase family protein [Burkholderiales bacterium]